MPSAIPWSYSDEANPFRLISFLDWESLVAVHRDILTAHELSNETPEWLSNLGDTIGELRRMAWLAQTADRANHPFDIDPLSLRLAKITQRSGDDTSLDTSSNRIDVRCFSEFDPEPSDMARSGGEPSDETTEFLQALLRAHQAEIELGNPVEIEFVALSGSIRSISIQFDSGTISASAKLSDGFTAITSRYIALGKQITEASWLEHRGKSVEGLIALSIISNLGINLVDRQVINTGTIDTIRLLHDAADHPRALIPR